MAMSTTRQDRENDKFLETSTGKTAIRVVTDAGSAGSLQLKTGVYGPISVTSTPQPIRVGATNFANRIIITMQPTDGTVYFGFDDQVDETTGTPIETNAFMPIYASEDLDVYVMTPAGTVDVRITEASDQ